MIQTIINSPKVLSSNTSPIVFDAVNIITGSTPCTLGGWLDYENGSPLFKILGKGYTGYYKRYIAWRYLCSPGRRYDYDVRYCQAYQSGTW